MATYPLIQSTTGTTIVQSATTPPIGDVPGIITRDARPAFALDMFGRQRMTQPTIIFTSAPSYDLDPLTWEVRTSGTGNTVTWDSATRTNVFTLASAGYTLRQTRRYFIYEPGRPLRIILTGTVGAAVSGAVKEFGIGDAMNGIFWRQEATGDMALVRRTSTSGSAVDTVYTRSQWNGDPLDGTGSSGYTIDVTKNQLYFIELAWLGAAGARWGVYVNGQIVYAHTQIYANAIDVPYTATMSLPIRWLITSAGTPGTPATIRQACAEIESEGGYFSAPSVPASGGLDVVSEKAVSSGKVPICALRPALTFGGITNRIMISTRGVDVAASGASANWYLIYYPPGSANPVNGTFAAVSAVSAAEINTDCTTLSLTGGYEILRGSVAASASSRDSKSVSITQVLPLSLDIAGSNDPRTSNVGANPAYLVLAAYGQNNAKASGGFEWWETR